MEYYAVQKIKSIDELKRLFPQGIADPMNVVLFSTSGIHGSYTTIEELFKPGEDGFVPDKITVLVIHPRTVSMRYGEIKVAKEDLEYLEILRASSWNELQDIGRP